MESVTLHAKTLIAQFEWPEEMLNDFALRDTGWNILCAAAKREMQAWLCNGEAWNVPSAWLADKADEPVIVEGR